MSQTNFLEAKNLRVGYGGRPVLENFNVALGHNEVLCLIGHNGNGKSTLLKALFGLVPLNHGTILLEGQTIERPDPRGMNAAGIALVPEGRGVFPGLTVAEIMRLGFWANAIPAGEHAARLDWVMGVLPMIKKFYQQRAATNGLTRACPAQPTTLSAARRALDWPGPETVSRPRGPDTRATTRT